MALPSNTEKLTRTWTNLAKEKLLTAAIIMVGALYFRESIGHVSEFHTENGGLCESHKENNVKFVVRVGIVASPRNVQRFLVATVGPRNELQAYETPI